MKIKKNPNEEKYKAISDQVDFNEGFCPCELIQNDDTHCICKAFREQQTTGFCHCGRYYKVDEPFIITLCGSTRFKDEFIEIQKWFTLMGFIVLSVGYFGHSEAEMENFEQIKKNLDELHKAKIEMSDAIFVINKDGYIGESTAAEIEWAQELGKEVFYLEEKGE